MAKTLHMPSAASPRLSKAGVQPQVRESAGILHKDRQRSLDDIRCRNGCIYSSVNLSTFFLLYRTQKPTGSGQNASPFADFTTFVPKTRARWPSFYVRSAAECCCLLQQFKVIYRWWTLRRSLQNARLRPRRSALIPSIPYALVIVLRTPD